MAGAGYECPRLCRVLGKGNFAAGVDGRRLSRLPGPELPPPGSTTIWNRRGGWNAKEAEIVGRRKAGYAAAHASTSELVPAQATCVTIVAFRRSD